VAIIRRGTHRHLEAAADAILKESLKGVTKHSEKSDILTPWKDKDRRNREVYVASGTPDPSSRRGLFHRAWNSEREDLNSRDGMVRGRRTGSSGSLSAFVAEHGNSDPDYEDSE
jgi:hypothetical protein